MYIDWLTWSIWALGLALLLYWCIQTVRELKSLFSRKRGLSRFLISNLWANIQLTRFTLNPKSGAAL